MTVLNDIKKGESSLLLVNKDAYINLHKTIPFLQMQEGIVLYFYPALMGSKTPT